MQGHEILFQRIRGHSCDTGNERADCMACRGATDERISELTKITTAPQPRAGWIGLACPPPWRFNSALSLVELTKRGLEAHLQEIVLDEIVDEQLQAFESKLRQALKAHVSSITLGHVHHVKDVLHIRDELHIRIDVNMQEVAR